MVDHGEVAAPQARAVEHGRAATPLVLVAGLSVLLLGSPAAARPTLDSTRLADLDRYEVLTFVDPAGQGIDRGKAIGVIDATPEEVFRIATDFGRYKDFMPRITQSEQVSRTADGAQVVITADLPLPIGHTWIEADYAFQRLPGDIFRIRFDMRRGNMKRYLGSLYIEPWSRTKTAITYELVAEPDVMAPKTFINRGVRRSVTKFVHALRQQINNLHKLGLLHPIAPPAPTQQATIVKPNPATLKARR